MQLRLHHIIAITLILIPLTSQAQVLLKSYYENSESVKEEFYVTSKDNNTLNGPYKSFFKNGNLKSEGQFVNNQSTGIWKYYFENGQLRMQGEIENGKGVGEWQYYFENGSFKMIGKMVEGKKQDDWVYYHKNGSKESEGKYITGKKDGFWKYYYPEGILRATEEFSGLGSYYEELYETGAIKAEGKRIGEEQVDEWLYYYEDGTIQARGNFVAGKKDGTWKYYDEIGRIEAEGRFDKDLANGIWIYYHSDGSVASKGELVEGEKNGNWQMFYNDGTLKGEANYLRGDGAYKEYYKNGSLKVKGAVKNGLNDGHWEYFYENGNLEGSCDFVMGEGLFKGFYNNGGIKMKGTIKNDIKVGIWELYEPSGEITGYYKPYYEDGESAFFIAEDNQEQKQLSEIRRARAGSSKTFRKKSRYFKKRIHEYKAFIIGYNPVAPLANVLPFSFEYYLEERLGYEVMVQYLRDPFFRSFSSISDDIVFSQGYSATVRQRFYHKEAPIGQPFFAHELKYTSSYHNINQSGERIEGAHEQKIEYGVVVGTRFFKNVNANGFTADAYVGFGLGYRDYQQNYVPQDPGNDPFKVLNSNNFAYSIRIGVNFGYAFRIKR